MGQRLSKLLTPYLFVAPNTLIFGVFVLLPMATAWCTPFTGATSSTGCSSLWA